MSDGYEEPSLRSHAQEQTNHKLVISLGDGHIVGQAGTRVELMASSMLLAGKP